MRVVHICTTVYTPLSHTHLGSRAATGVARALFKAAGGSDQDATQLRADCERV